MCAVSESLIDRSQPITVGHIFSLHGVSGAIKARVLSDVSHRFDVGQVLYVRNNPYSIISSNRIPNEQIILRFCGVDSLAAAQSLVGEDMTVPETSVPSLPQGEYFHFQLVGLRVFTEQGEELGELKEIPGDGQQRRLRSVERYGRVVDSRVS